jgi:hypothetical protein
VGVLGGGFMTAVGVLVLRSPSTPAAALTLVVGAMLIAT